MNQSCGECFYFCGRALRGAWFPQIGAQVEVFVRETIAFAEAGFKVSRSRKIVSTTLSCVDHVQQGALGQEQGLPRLQAPSVGLRCHASA